MQNCTMAIRKGNRYAPLVAIILLLLALGAVRLMKGCGKTGNEVVRPKERTERETTRGEPRGLNRNPAHIEYSKHARCRMDCRHISESEVLFILKNGKINYRKSDLDGAECRKKYAVEGKTNDGQRVRIIFAPCQEEVTVVTVIDLGTEWPCECD
jgi:hypothetical protein